MLWDNGPDADAFGRPDALLLGACGWLAIAGAVALVASNVVGSILVPNYDWVADTISDLAAGRYEIIQDVGFYAFAGSLLANAIGASNVHPGTTRWTFGAFGLAVMAALVVVIGARNEYGDQDAPATWAVHLGLVYTLMVLFLAVTLAMAREMGRLRAGYRRFSVVCAALFVVSAAAYFMAPTGYDGLIERAVGLLAVAWVCASSWMLLDLRNGLGQRGMSGEGGRKE